MGLKYYLIIITILFGGFLSNAQESKEDIDKQAQALFKKGEFVEATPLFLRLLSLEPRNPNYNYKYGTCLLYNADKNSEAFKYLNYSIQKDSEVDAEAYYYLGKAYHLTYRFNKAIKNYEIYKQKAGAKALANLQVDRQIEMCRNGKTQFSDITETIVLEKTQIDLKSFFRIYDLKDIGGNLIVAEEFQSKQDKKNNHIPLIHFPINSDYIYYSSYGSGSDNKDIYFRYRTKDGGWSKESPVLGDVNTQYNEDYPYMHPNGKYLYFSSEGHKSMGGYDVFRSEFDQSTNTFGIPENMNISISSPDNDFLYIVDSLDKHAYFASQRESETNNVHVYKVRLERLPMQMIVLKGNFNSKINPTHKIISIKVNDLAGDLVGSFTSNNKGEYNIRLPKNGKYEFVVKLDKSNKEFKEIISIPKVNSFRPLKQSISEIDKDGQNLIVFNNLFNEKVDNYDEILAEAIEEKAKMNINRDQFNLDSLDKVLDEKRVFDQVGLADYTNVEIRDLIQTKFKDLYLRQTSTDSLILKSRYIVQNGNESIKQAMKSADSLTKLSKENPGDPQVERWNTLADRQIEKSRTIQNDMHNAQVILSYLEKDYAEKESLLTTSKNLNDGIKGLETSNTKGLIDVVSKYPTFVSEELLVRTKTNAYFEYLAVINEQLRLRDDLIVRKDSLKREKQTTKTNLDKLRRDYEAASSRAKEDISFEISKAEIRLEGLENEIKYTEEVIEEKSKIADQKQTLAQISRSPIEEDMVAQHNLAEEFERLKNELAERQSNSKTVTTKEELAENTTQNKEEVPETEDTQGTSESEELAENETSNALNNETEENKIEVESNEEIEEEEVVIIPTLFVLDPKYTEEIAQIELAIEEGTSNKSDLVERKTQAITKIQEAKNVVAEQIAENPGDKNLARTNISLNKLEVKLFAEITVLNTEIDAEGGVIASAVETEGTEENEIENALAPNETKDNETALENNEVLNNEDNTNEQSENEVAPKTFTVPTLAEIDADYSKDIAQLESAVESGDIRKTALIARKNEAIIKVKDAQVEATEIQAEQPENNSVSTMIEKLNSIENSLISEVEVLENEIALENEMLAATLANETSEEVNDNNTSETALEANELDTNQTELVAENETSNETLPNETSEEVNDNNTSETAVEVNELDTNQTELVAENETSNETLPNETSEEVNENNTSETALEANELDTNQNELIAENETSNETLPNETSEEVNENNTSETALETSTPTSMLVDIDPDYSEDIAQIEQDIDEGTSGRNELIKRRFQAALKVHESKEETIVLLSETPENLDLAVRIKELDNLENQIYSEIETIENEIAEENELIAENEKANTTNSEVETSNEIAENTEEINAEINTNTEEVNNEIAETLETVENETANETELVAETTSEETESKQLNNEIESSNEIAENTEEINAEINSNTEEVNNEIAETLETVENETANEEAVKVPTEDISSVSNPAKLLMEIDANYLNEIAQIEQEIQEGTKTNSDLIKRKYKVLIDVGDVKSETLKEEEVNPTPILAQKIKTISNIENQIVGEINELENIELVAANKIKTNTSFDDVQLINSISRASVPNKIQNSLSNKDQLKINNLFNEKDQLEQEISANPELAENKKVRAKMKKIDNSIATELSIALQNSLVTNYPDLVSKSDKLMQNSPEEISSLSAQQSIVKIEQLLQKSSEKENPVEIYALFQEAYNEQEKTLQLIKDTRTQKQIDNYIAQVSTEQNLDNIETETVALTETEIMREQNQINLKLVNLNEQINELNAMIPNANKQGVATIEYNINQLQQIKTGLENKIYTNSKALDQIEEQRRADANKGISNEAIKNTLTYKEEVEIARSKEYIDQLRNNNRLTQAQYELRIKEAQLNSEQTDLKEIYDEIKASGRLTDENKEAIKTQLNVISKTKNEVVDLRENVQSKQNDVAMALPNDPELRYKTENMIARDVAPLKAIPMKTSSMALVKTGLVIGEKAEATYSDENPIPIISEQDDQMSGLIFRVQIGAFRNPVPNQTFSEFSPITGDKIGSGWIKYVVGLFGNRDVAADARDRIRTMGYSDAFIVAYCDGERIPVYRAVQLASTGACVSQINADEDLIAEVNTEVDSTTATSTATAANRAPKLDELAYNKTIGAAEADVVENKAGLFYTVQVGVYNTPATAEQLNNVSPLITKRLPTGLIRYSSGVFDSYEAAVPKRNQVVEKGISDAYIVAYYKGLRITASEANEILKAQGDVVLQSKMPKASRNDIATNETMNTVNETQEAFINDRNTKNMLVSSKRYPEFPIQELNRYNEEGELFYYDSKTKRIQSFLFGGNTIASQFIDDFDKVGVYNNAYPIVNSKTPYRKNAIENPESNLIHLEVAINNEDLNSDLMEAIMNTPVIKEMKTNKNQLVVNFYAVDVENNQFVVDRLQAVLTKLGATEVTKTAKTF